jgi:hypothetical protein
MGDAAREVLLWLDRYLGPVVPSPEKSTASETRP